MDTRRATIDIDYEGVNITKDISKDLLSFSFTDNASGTADNISITLKDNNAKWISSWAPVQGDKIRTKILTQNWRYEGDFQRFNCGTFIVDEPTYSGRPRTLSINAISVPSNNNFRDTNNSRTWEKVTIQKIAKDIANNADISLFYDVSFDIQIDFVEQSEQPDIEFLFEICKNNGLSMKVYNEKIVIFLEKEYENKPTIADIYESKVTSWTANLTLTESGYDGVILEYSDPTNGNTLKYEYYTNSSKKKILKLNTKATSLAEAERIAKAKLRELNKNQYTMTFSMAGNVDMIASSTINVIGFGIFDGKYYIDKVTHDIGSGYTTNVDIHRVLEGY